MAGESLGAASPRGQKRCEAFDYMKIRWIGEFFST
jgi:hypothetical protein